ncbi:redoxin domain-containing protein [Flagellimonas olearia]|uniref:Redoxin domain-containing protein n=1 Tax=Flagellimonas olearia TaxID=552546 RepID=A0A6I1DWM9_9FLAO|nr:TlpA disulfide reductase family protein [Allomuricauda olearia]KAB7529598.1 redoxin domain-containing protein [Allomuricauda olearia]
MKFSKEQISNGIWLLAIVLILFTPVGFHLKVLVSKLISTSADVVDTEEQKTLTNYQWGLVDVKGQRINFESFKDQVVVVNIWATWCPPCVAELPSFVELYGDYKDKVVFAFVANDDRDKVLQFLEKKGYQLPVYFQTTSTPKELVSKSIPATYVISKSGKIVVDEKGAADWNSQKTRELLDRLILE